MLCMELLSQFIEIELRWMLNKREKKLDTIRIHLIQSIKKTYTLVKWLEEGGTAYPPGCLDHSSKLTPWLQSPFHRMNRYVQINCYGCKSFLECEPLVNDDSAKVRAIVAPLSLRHPGCVGTTSHSAEVCSRIYTDGQMSYNRAEKPSYQAMYTDLQRLKTKIYKHL